MPLARERDVVENRHALGEGLVNRTPPGNLLETFPLSLVERSVNRHRCLNPIDPSLCPLVTVGTIVRMHAVEAELDVHRAQAYLFVIGVHP